MTQHRPERRARTVAMVGLIFSILVSVFFLLLTSWSDSEALRALTRFTAVGNLIWFFLVLIYHQRVLVQDEAFESEQIRRERAAGVIGEAIFDVDDEELLLARRRLRWMYRWVLPAFTILIIGSLVAVGLAAWEWELNASVWRRDWPGVKHSGLLAWFVGGASFLSFLLSRYAVGMARHAEWRMLRAGASWLMGVTLAGLTLVVTLGILHFSPTSPVSERILAYVLRILLLVLAGEILLNFVLDFYRPRGVDDEPRPAFDSRLLGLFSEPGGIARSIAEAINYQFGFEVSSTWFYKLLQRSVVPLLGFGVAAMLAASCLVFVENNEEAVVERFGSRLPRVLGPGVHAKLPWPVDIAYKVASSKVHELKIGIEPPKDPNRPPRDDDSLILWTNQHSQEPHLEVLVATPRLESYVARAVLASQPAAGAPTTQPGEADAPIQAGEAVAVSMMRVAVSLQYQIRDAADWLTTYDKPEEMLKAIANREIIRYCASVDVNGLIGGQRSQIEKALWETIQKRTDEAKLGVEIVFLGLQGVHPPETTAEEFQEVVGAEQKAAASIHKAEAEARAKLSEVAGDEDRAKRLAAAIREVNALEADPSSDPQKREAAISLLNVLFLGDADQNITPVGGKASERVAQARAERWRTENTRYAQARTFEQERVAKAISPRVYQNRKIFEALTQAGGNLRKYIIESDNALQLNLQDPMSAPLDTALQDEQ